MISKVSLSAVVLLVALCLQASGTQRTFEVAVPEEPGRLSLTLFDASGRPVRALIVLTDVAELDSGLNGVLVPWDGADAGGRPVPPGSYSIRGVFVPQSVDVHGEQYLFNDWEGPADAPPIADVLALASAGGGEFVLGAHDSQSLEPTAWDGDSEGRLLPRLRLRAGLQILALSDRGVLGLEADQALWVPLDGSEEHPLTKTQGVPLAALNQDSGALASTGSQRVTVCNLGNPASPQSEYVLPAPLSLLAAAGEGFVVVLQDGSVHRLTQGSVVETSAGDTRDMTSLSVGPEGSFWVVGLAGEGSRVVRNFDPAKGLLREMRLGPESAEVAVVGDPEAPGFFLITRTGGATMVGSFQPANPGTGSPAWETAFERTMRESQHFGFLGGRPAPQGPAENRVKVGIAASALDPTPRIVVLRVAHSAAGAWLETLDGLPIVEIAHLPNIHRTALHAADTPGSVRVLLGQPGSVAEFRVSGLQGLSLLDEGTIEVRE